MAPGTAGALPGVLIFWVFWRFLPTSWMPWLLASALAAVSALTVALGNWSESYWKKKDPGCFVLDEVAGYLLTVLIFSGRHENFWLTAAWTFAATRVLDIIKVPPARQLEKLPGGWGILLDDLAASLYAGALLHAAAWAGLRQFMG